MYACTLWDVAVLPALRRRGLGRLVVERLVAQAQVPSLFDFSPSRSIFSLALRRRGLGRLVVSGWSPRPRSQVVSSSPPVISSSLSETRAAVGWAAWRSSGWSPEPRLFFPVSLSSITQSARLLSPSLFDFSPQVCSSSLSKRACCTQNGRRRGQRKPALDI